MQTDKTDMDGIEFPDPCFRDPPRDYHYPTPNPALAADLAFAVTRHPQDLQNHVRRVYLHLDLDDPQRLFGALVDLFIVLGSRGRALRGRLLTLASPGLKPGQRAFLRGHLDSGLGADTPLPSTAGSRLTRSVGGRLELVTRGHRAAGLASPLEEARGLIDDGLLDEARTLLEQALLWNPRDEALHRELLDLYRHTRDLEALKAMQARLAGLDNPLAEDWDQLHRQLTDQATTS